MKKVVDVKWRQMLEILNKESKLEKSGLEQQAAIAAIGQVSGALRPWWGFDQGTHEQCGSGRLMFWQQNKEADGVKCLFLCVLWAFPWAQVRVRLCQLAALQQKVMTC